MKITRLLTLLLLPLVTGCATATDDTVSESTFTYSETEVSFQSGKLRLGGLLFMPEGNGPYPGVVFIRGSGDSHRDSMWARAFTDHLASHGIAVLLPDKRGNGTSEGDWREADMADYARDTVAGVDFLGSLPGVDHDRVGVIGLSQGGHVAPLAGDLESSIAFVINISGSATTLVEQVDHEMRNTFRQAGLDEEGIAAGMQLQRLAERYVRTGDWDSYASAMKVALNSPLAPVAEGFPQDRDAWVWDWWRGVGDYDPVEHWSSLSQPALVVYGEEDELDNVPVRESVRRLQSVAADSPGQLDILVYPESGHAIYTPGTHQVRPELLRHLVEWIHRNS